MFEGACKMESAGKASPTPTPLAATAPPELPKR